MRKLITILLLLISTVAVRAQSTLLAGVQNQAVSYSYLNGWGSTPNMYIYLPWDYYVSGKKYPVIMFFSGSGERGINVTSLLGNGIPQLISQGTIPYSYNGVDTTKFIVTSLQTLGTENIDGREFGEWIKTLQMYNLSIDSTRIYITGLSKGANEVMVLPGSTYNGWGIAADIPMSSNGGLGLYTERFQNTPAWFFHGNTDNAHTTGVTAYNTLIAQYPEQHYKLTVYPGAHCCWNTYYNPAWNDASGVTNSPSGDGLGVYSWAMQYDNTTTATPRTDFSINLGNDTIVTTGNIFSFANSAAIVDDSALGGLFNPSPTWKIISKAAGSGYVSFTGPFYSFKNQVLSGMNVDGDYVVSVSIENQYGEWKSDTITITRQIDNSGEGGGTDPVPDSLRQVRIDFSGLSSWNVYGWNNFKSNSTSTGIINNLQDNEGAGTGINIQLTSTFTGVTSSGNPTGNNSGIMPDSVLQRGFYVGGGKVGSFQITGLNDTVAYNFQIVGSSNNNTGPHMTVYQLNDKIDSLEARVNSSNAVNINAVYPTGGIINLSVKEGTGVVNGYLNGLTMSWANTDTTVYIDTPSYKIPLDTATKFFKGDTVFYQMNDIKSSNLVNSLIDEQGADPKAGLFTPTPVTIFESGATTKMFYPATAVIDLGGYYKITDTWFYTTFGVDTLCILHGSPFNWSTDTLKIGTNGSGWKSVPNDTMYTRYLKIFYMNMGYQKVSEIMFYGYLVGDSLPRTNPDPHPLPTKTNLTMGQFIGFNAEGPADVDSVGNLIRHYDNQNWLDTALYEHNVDSIKFVFSVFAKDGPGKIQNPINYFFPNDVDGPWKTGYYLNHDEKVAMMNSGGAYFDALQELPQYFVNLGVGKPIDTVNHPLRDATNPNSYDRTARLFWTYAAYYGYVTHPPDSMQTPYPETSGIAERDFVETGNEMNQDWSGRDRHYTPEEAAAYNSAVYDGNEGKMGSRMGIKNADPNMQVIQAGTAGAHIDYLQGLKYFAYYKRSDHKVPFDIINFHAYPTNGTNGSGTDPHAASPEVYFDNPNNPVLGYVKEANEVMPGKPVWLTEWGYDKNPNSPLSVAPVEGQDVRMTQGQWIARYWLMLSFSGVQRATMFQLSNVGPDSTTGGKFGTSGIAAGLYDGNAHTGNPAIYATNWHAFAGYYFQRTLWLRLFNYKPDSIVYSNNDSIYVYRYRNADHPDSVCYAIWSGTQTNRSADQYSLRTGHANTAAQIVALQDKMMMGASSTYTANADGEIPILINETPKLIFTTDAANGGELVNTGAPATPPIANAGSDQTLASGTTSTTLSGSATPGTGAIVSYQWTQVSGPAATIASPNTASTGVTGLQDGQSYIFRLTVTDANGLTNSDDVAITVDNGAPVVGMKLKYVKYIDNDIYLIWEDENGKLYSTKLKGN